MEKFEVELKIVKNKIHEEDLTEDFRDKLERQLYEKYNNANANKIKFKLLRRPLLACKNVAAVFVCFLLLSGCAFADEIEDLIKSMFSNVSQNAEIAYEEGNCIKVDSEYQTYGDISAVSQNAEIAYEEGNCIKVDSEYQTYGDISANVEYISSKDNELYIVFNIRTQENFDKIYLDGLTLEDESGEIKYLYSSYDVKFENKKECKLIAKVSLNSNEKKDIESLKITLNKILLKNGDKVNICDNNWKFELNL